jgi:hypothetical protein
MVPLLYKLFSLKTNSILTIRFFNVLGDVNDQWPVIKNQLEESVLHVLSSSGACKSRVWSINNTSENRIAYQN